jgi:enoyl-CoA hydratase
MPDEVRVTHEAPLLIVKIQRPHARNAINRAAADALREAFLAFDDDPALRVAILTGDAAAFCAGADLKDIEGLTPSILSDHGPLGVTRLQMSKPVIAAVSGYAVAGGLELALWCDLRIADETAVFGCFERRWGVPLVDGGTQRLPRIVGLGRALEMILTGRAVHAQEALAWGLVNEVVPTGQALDRARELGRTIASFPQTCLLNDRQAVYDGLGRDLVEGLTIEARLGQATVSSGETLSGAQRFAAGHGRGGRFDDLA